MVKVVAHALVSKVVTKVDLSHTCGRVLHFEWCAKELVMKHHTCYKKQGCYTLKAVLKELVMEEATHVSRKICCTFFERHAT